MQYTLQTLVDHLQAHQCEAEIDGDADRVVSGIQTLANARSDQLTFLANTKYRGGLSSTDAGACLITKEDAKLFEGEKVICADPYFAYSMLSHLFDKSREKVGLGIHKSAVIAPTAMLSESVSIGPNVVIEEGAVIGNHVVIGANCVVGENTTIGDDSRLHAQVVLYSHVTLGARVTIHSGSVIGADGFGFANREGRWHKIAQLGGVTVGDDVDIGASTTIDRGALEDTVIGQGVIIDNQVQIAHNVRIGDHTAIAGCVGIAGSTTVGRYCTIAGAVGIAGHLTLCDHTHVTMQSQVTRSIKEPGSYSSGTGILPTVEWRKAAVYFRQLDSWRKRLKEKR